MCTRDDDDKRTTMRPAAGQHPPGSRRGARPDRLPHPPGEQMEGALYTHPQACPISFAEVSSSRDSDLRITRNMVLNLSTYMYKAWYKAMYTRYM